MRPLHWNPQILERKVGHFIGENIGLEYLLDQTGKSKFTSMLEAFEDGEDIHPDMPNGEMQQVVEDDVSGEMCTAATLAEHSMPSAVSHGPPLLGELSAAPLVDEEPPIEGQSVAPVDEPPAISLVDEPPLVDLPTNANTGTVDVSYHPFISHWFLQYLQERCIHSWLQTCIYHLCSLYCKLQRQCSIVWIIGIMHAV